MWGPPESVGPRVEIPSAPVKACTDSFIYWQFSKETHVVGTCLNLHSDWYLFFTLRKGHILFNLHRIYTVMSLHGYPIYGGDVSFLYKDQQYILGTHTWVLIINIFSASSGAISISLRHKSKGQTKSKLEGNSAPSSLAPFILSPWAKFSSAKSFMHTVSWRHWHKFFRLAQIYVRSKAGVAFISKVSMYDCENKEIKIKTRKTTKSMTHPSTCIHTLILLAFFLISRHTILVPPQTIECFFPLVLKTPSSLYLAISNSCLWSFF